MISQQASANTTKSCLRAIVVCDVKMDQRWILVILVFYQSLSEITSGAGVEKIVKEGNNVEIQCEPSVPGSMVVWFRVLDNSGMEFIASFSNNGIQKTASSSFSSIFTTSKITQNILILKSFKKISDSGVYSCAALYKGTELKFGTVTRLLGEKTTPAQLTTTKTTIRQSPCTTAAPCVCNNNYKKEETSPSMFCTPIILGPLVGACGLLLLLLIVITVYCNHVRTRRCPHHYKRKPRATAAGKQMMTGRHV